MSISNNSPVAGAIRYHFSSAELPPAPNAEAVKTKKLATAIEQAYDVYRHHSVGAGLDPHSTRTRDSRETLWNAFDDVLKAGARASGERPELKVALQAMREFNREFGQYRATGDQNLQSRLLNGYSPSKPGLKDLFTGLFEAAGMGAPRDLIDSFR